MTKEWKVKVYMPWDMYEFGLPMPVWEKITCFEGYGISIQFNEFRFENKPIEIVHIDSKVQWSWKFDDLLWEFMDMWNEWVEVVVVNVLNKWLVKYFKKHNIKIIER